MTNEEKAEEYTDSINTIIYDIEDNAINIAKYLRKAHLDGLAKGKPKWHDLRKNPEDLPKGNDDCLCFISECYFVGHYAKEDKEWHFDEFISNEVIAWTEIPKFEEE